MPEETPTVQNGSGWVVIHHPGTGGYAEVTREAFDVDHSSKGWKIAAEWPDDVAATRAGAKVKEG